ncbi:hypothetical protein JCM11491_006872 [Sporobolomyces phaffii]
MASDLTDDQLLTYTSLLDLGFSPERSRQAALRFANRAEEAANWLFEHPDSDYRPSTPTAHPPAPPAPPPPPPPPPAYDSVYGPETYTELAKTAPADIDLTLDDDGDSDRKGVSSAATTGGIEASDLQRAIEASTATTTTRVEVDAANADADADADADMDKALALSMASLGSHDHDDFVERDLDALDRLEPDLLVRPDDAPGPVGVRTRSPHMAALSSYLAALYAVPTWRNTVLAWRAPNPDVAIAVGHDTSFDGVWKGESNLPPLVDDDDAARIQRLVSVQRLFALLNRSKRAFVHCQEVVQAFNLREHQFHVASGVSTIKELHSQLIQDLDATTMTPGTPGRDASVSSVLHKFVVRGRKVVVDRHLGAPLPPVSSRDDNDDSDNGAVVSTEFLDLWINPAAQDEQTFFERLDSVLLRDHYVAPVPPPPPEGAPTSREATLTGEYDLVVTDKVGAAAAATATLAFALNRHTEVTSLDQFGTGSSSSNSTSTTQQGVKSKRNVFGVEREVWLDRYAVARRREIRDKRVEWYGLRDEKRVVRDRRDRLATTKDGKDAVEVVRGVVEYLESTAAEQQQDGDDGDEAGQDRTTSERHERMRTNYRAILDAMETKLRDYEAQLDSVSTAMSNLYASPAWRTLGPYELASVVVRTGLNGRGSSYSIVRDSNSDSDSTWWKLVDLKRDRLSPDEVEHALVRDPTGVFLDAGIALAFYQLQGAETDTDADGEVEVDQTLARLVERDNLKLADTLPDRDALVERWHLDRDALLVDVDVVAPGLSSAAGAAGEDDAEELPVQDIELSPPPPPPQSMMRESDNDDNEGAAAAAGTPMSIETAAPPPDDDDELEPLLDTDPELPATPASREVDRDSSDEEVAMRLRGGAPEPEPDTDEDEYSEEYDEEEGMDEDEVELGLLEAMPAAWDVDYAVGKVGGVPVWLDPRAPLSTTQVACAACRKTMSLLVQVNSPDDARPHAAARSLYVFACRTPTCRGDEAIKVWRTQMASPNDFFPHTEASVNKRRQLELALAPTLGLIRDDDASPTPTKTPQPWPEWNIQAEPEPYEESYLPDDRTSAAAGDDAAIEGEDADAPDTVSGVDKEFLVFQERIEREPNQVLRFYRLPDVEAPEPLWTSSKKIDPLVDVPACPLCQGPRQVEFQILSTLLSHLNDDHLEFDSLLVYTCLDNCEIPPTTPTATDDDDDDDETKTGWAQEVVIKQEFTSSGVRFGGAAVGP